MDSKNLDGEWTIGKWSPNFYTVDIGGTTPTTSPEVTTKPIETTAPVETTKPVETTIPVTGDLLGDVNGDKKVNVRDATLIQKAIAQVAVEVFLEDLADTDENGSIDIRDATAVQKWVADMLANSNIGKPVE